MFSMRADDDVSLAIVERRHSPVLATLWSDNAQRLTAWEPWAGEPGALDDPSGWIRYCLDRFAQGSAVFAFIRKEDQAVGTCGLWIEHDLSCGSLGYMIDAKHEGQGLVTRAVRRMVDYAFDEREISRLELTMAHDHERSRAVAARLGFALAGTEADGLKFADRAVDSVSYVLHRPG